MPFTSSMVFVRSATSASCATIRCLARRTQRLDVDAVDLAELREDARQIRGARDPLQREQRVERRAHLLDLARDGAADRLARAECVGDGAAKTDLRLAELLLDAQAAMRVVHLDGCEGIATREHDVALLDLVVEEREHVACAGDLALGEDRRLDARRVARDLHARCR